MNLKAALLNHVYLPLSKSVSKSISSVSSVSLRLQSVFVEVVTRK